MDSHLWVPLWKISGPQERAGSQFGFSTAALEDTVVVGSPMYGAGTAHVFTRIGPSWPDQALPFEGPVAGDRIGFSVAISRDTVAREDTLVVGAKWATDTSPNQGAAYVFTGSGLHWDPRQTLLGWDGAQNDYFGTSVATSGDTIVVGAYGASGVLKNSGAAYAFVRNGTSWDPQAKLIPDHGANLDYFGYAVALSGDVAVVGAYRHGGTGAAYVFERSGTSWGPSQNLAGPSFVDSSFGFAVAMSETTIVVGAPGDNEDGYYGAAYVFARSDAGWIREATLVAGDGLWASEFGHSVAIAGDTIVVGTTPSPTADDGMGQGSVYVFGRSSTGWIQQQKLLAPDPTPNESARQLRGDRRRDGLRRRPRRRGEWIALGRGLHLRAPAGRGGPVPRRGRVRLRLLRGGRLLRRALLRPVQRVLEVEGRIRGRTCANIAASPAIPVRQVPLRRLEPHLPDGVRLGRRVRERVLLPRRPHLRAERGREGELLHLRAGPQGVVASSACLAAALVALAARSRRRQRR